MISPHLDVVVADDQKSARDAVARILMTAGIRAIRHAVDGAHAWGLICERRPDLIILDLEMPYDGITTLRHIRRASEPIRKIPVVIATANATRSNLQILRDAGAHGVVAKPVTANTLLGQLDVILGQPRAFVDAPVYAGPDRRRAPADGYLGPPRRASDFVEGDTLKIA